MLFTPHLVYSPCPILHRTQALLIPQVVPSRFFNLSINTVHRSITQCRPGSSTAPCPGVQDRVRAPSEPGAISAAATSAQLTCLEISTSAAPSG